MHRSMEKRVIVDTNVLIRLFIKDGSYQEAESILRNADEVFIPDIVVYETIYVLQTLYKVPRLDILRCLKIFDLEKIELENGVIIRTAIDYYIIHQELSFADCYLLAKWVLSEDTLATLDKRLQQKVKEYNIQYFGKRREVYEEVTRIAMRQSD